MFIAFVSSLTINMFKEKADSVPLHTHTYTTHLYAEHVCYLLWPLRNSSVREEVEGERERAVWREKRVQSQPAGVCVRRQPSWFSSAVIVRRALAVRWVDFTSLVFVKQPLHFFAADLWSDFHDLIKFLETDSASAVNRTFLHDTIRH